MSEASFAGASAVVVGGGAGLGRQYCLDLARHGARVLVVGRGESAAAVTREIVATGGDAVACVADARDGDRIVKGALAAFGRIDALIVNAGIVRDRSFAKMSREEWSEVLSVHVDGAFSCARAAWEPMSKQGGGAILFTTSGAGMHGNFGQANYAAAKGAILGLARSLALEGASRKIRGERHRAHGPHRDDRAYLPAADADRPARRARLAHCSRPGAPARGGDRRRHRDRRRLGERDALGAKRRRSFRASGTAERPGALG